MSWKPSFHEFQELFLNDFSLKIFVIVSQHTSTTNVLCASDIAKILNIHISTVTKYLDLLCKYQLVEKEQILNKPGKPTYYSAKTKQLTINLDSEYLASTLVQTEEQDTLPNPCIREMANLQPRVVFQFDENGVITSFKVKQTTRAKRLIRREIKLSNVEGDFMKYLPYPTMRPQKFLDICQNAGIYDYFTIKRLIPFVNKLEKYEIIEIEENLDDRHE